jgi:two-component system NarL family sensor kinase
LTVGNAGGAQDAERALLAERILAEQEERRRLAELLHDGPVQQLSALSQLLDAALEGVRLGESGRASEILERALGLSRTAAQDLRALCDELEPQALRELGFEAAISALARRISSRQEVEVEVDVHGSDELGEHAQVGLYQIVRDAIDQAVRRGAPTIEVRLKANEKGGVELIVSDDGTPERRSVVLEALAERAATLNARFTSEGRWPRGSLIRVELPPSAAHR